MQYTHTHLLWRSSGVNPKLKIKNSASSRFSKFKKSFLIQHGPIFLVVSLISEMDSKCAAMNLKSFQIEWCWGCLILCSKLKNGLWKIVTYSQVVSKSNESKSRFHCINNKYWWGKPTNLNYAYWHHYGKLAILFLVFAILP